MFADCFGTGHAPRRVAEVSTMRLGTVARVYLLAAMMALAIFDTFPRRIALAQIPEAPGTFTNSSGGARIPQGPVDTGRRRKDAKPTGEPTPSARDTIDELERARARASGTPMPMSTPPGLGRTQ
jgi:hypothetical protein